MIVSIVVLFFVNAVYYHVYSTFNRLPFTFGVSELDPPSCKNNGVIKREECLRSAFILLSLVGVFLFG